MHWFEKAYVAIPVPVQYTWYLLSLQYDINRILVEVLWSDVVIKKPQEFHITIDYLGKKTEAKKQEFIEHFHTITNKQQSSKTYFDQLSYWKSFLSEDGHIISLTSTDQLLQEIYASLKIHTWESKKTQELPFYPHITLLNFYVSEKILWLQDMFLYRIKPLLKQPFHMTIQEYLLHDKR